MSDMILKVPTTVRHFHKSSGRLVATIVAVPIENNRLAVGIARASKKEKRPSRSGGRDRAEARVRRGLGIYENSLTDKSLALAERAQKLFVTMTRKEFDSVLENNPFKSWGCPFGVTKEDFALMKKRAKLQKEEAQARRERKAKKKAKKVKKTRVNR